LFDRTFSYIKLIEYQTFTAKDVDKDTFEGNRLFDRTFSHIKLIEYQKFTAKDVDKDTFEGNLFELCTLRAIDFKEYSF